MERERLTTKQDFCLVQKLFAMIGMQFEYHYGKVNQEMINRVEEQYKWMPWSWDTIPTKLFIGALEDLNENRDLFQTYKHILKDSTQEELDAVGSILIDIIGMQFAYIDGELSQEDIKEAEDFYGEGWSWKTIPTRMVLAVLNTLKENPDFKTPVYHSIITPA
jgi:hypothetical protein